MWAPGESLGFDDVVAAMEAMSVLTGGHPHPTLALAREGGALDRRARAELSRRSDLQSAVAIVVGTPLSRISGNLLIAVNQPAMPTRLFDDEGTAVVG